jgi:hypothetical protein
MSPGGGFALLPASPQISMAAAEPPLGHDRFARAKPALERG